MADEKKVKKITLAEATEIRDNIRKAVKEKRGVKHG
jgi:hypothetical protein